MGKIFTPEEFDLRNIPDEESFQEIVELLRSHLSQEAGVLGGAIIGSVLNGEYNWRSDIDCLVVYEDGYHNAVHALFTQLIGWAKERHVPLSFIPLSHHLANSSLHHVGFGLVKHIEGSLKNGGAIKENPLRFIKTDHLEILSDLLPYIQTKVRSRHGNLIDLPFMDDKEQARACQKALETPIHLARKHLLAMNCVLKDDRKSTVISIYADCLKGDRKKLFQELVRIDENYTKVLGTVYYTSGFNGYARVFKNVKRAVPLSFEFFRETAIDLSKRAP